MKVIDLINQRDKRMISFEITPPDKGKSIEEIFNTIDRLQAFDPSLITVTYHQQQVMYEEKDGVIYKIPKRKKPGTVGICAAIKNKYEIETVPHFICGGFSKYDTEDALIDLNFLGFENIFVIRGDPPPGQKNFIPEKDGHKHALDLVYQINNMNKGVYLEDLDNAMPTDFCVGVAAYPEKHLEAPNIKRDLFYLKKKVDAGADYIITQMLFNIESYRRFLELTEEMGINVPIIPGVKPLTRTSQLYTLPRDFHVEIPDEIVDKMTNANTKKEARRAGIEFTINLCQELLELDVPGLHFFTMGKASAVRDVLSEIG